MFQINSMEENREIFMSRILTSFTAQGLEDAIETEAGDCP